MKVICFGDSNTYGYDPRSLFGEAYDPENRWVDLLAAKTGWQVINLGQNGREVPDGPEAFPEDTDLLLVMLGTNDLLQLDSPEAAAERMEEFLLGVNLPKENLLLIAPPPMVPGAWVQDEELIEDCRKMTAYYRDLGAKLGIAFADAGLWGVSLGFDGVHFTEEGHRAFAEGLYGYLTGKPE